MREWCATAERLEGDAREAEGAGHQASVRGLYLRAASYCSTGLYLITHSKAPERQLEIWKRHRACWDKVVDLTAVPGERLQIPNQDTTLPGYFFRAPDAGPGDSRYDLYQEVLKYRLGDEVKRVTTPLLITEPEDEQFWPGQSQALYDPLPGPKELVRFTPPRAPAGTASRWAWPSATPACSTGSAATWRRSRRCCRG